MDMNQIQTTPGNVSLAANRLYQLTEPTKVCDNKICTDIKNTEAMVTNQSIREDEFQSFDMTIRRISNQLTEKRRRRSEVGLENSDTTNLHDIDLNQQRPPQPSIIEEVDDELQSDICTPTCSNTMVQDTASVIFNAKPRKQSNYISCLVGIFVAVGGFLFGYDTGLINSLIEMPYVRTHLAPNHFAFTTTQLSVLVSFLSLGTFIGALFTPIASDTFGRKLMIIFSTAIIFSIGISLQVGSISLGLLVAGRFVSGLGIGVVSATVPSYQAESAKKNLRGAIISTYQWAITWGLLASCAVAQGTYSIQSAASYRIPIGLQYVWSFILAIGMCFLPESPRYYVMKDKLHEAAKSLSFLRGVPVEDSGLLEELVEIKANFDYEEAMGSSSFLDCFISSKERPKQSLRMLTGIAVQIFQQFSGVNFIFYYGISFLEKSGVHQSYIISFILYAVNVAFSIPGLFLVEYIGRRKLLIVGGFFMALSNFIIAIVGVSVKTSVADKIMIAFMCSFIASYSATWGGVVWVLSAELYPLGVRAKCSAMCAATNWLANFVCALITPYIINMGVSETTSLGPKIYFIWGSLNALGAVMVYFIVYETRGLTLEQIDELYESSCNAFESSKWNKVIRKRRINFCKVNNINNSKANNNTPVPKWVSTSNDATHKSINNTTLKYMDDAYSLRSLNTGHSNNSNDDRGIDITQQIVTTDSHILLERSDPTDRLFTKAPPILSSDITALTDLMPGPIDESGIVDLGNGLTLNMNRRGPPSLSSGSLMFENGEGDGEHESTNTSYQYYSDREHMDLVNEYVSQIVRGCSPQQGLQQSNQSFSVKQDDSNDISDGCPLDQANFEQFSQLNQDGKI